MDVESIRGWGHIAANQWIQDDVDAADGPGLIRTVDGDVKYSRARCFHYAWEPTSHSQKYFLAIDLNEDIAKTLKDAVTEIQPAILVRRDRAIELDSVADALLEITASLHAEGRGLELITPENILVFGKQVILLDHGFTYDGQIVEPRWVTEPPFPQIWEAPTDRRRVGRQMQFDAERDVRVLARLFQGMLLDRWQADIVDGPEIRKLTRNKQLWVVLDKATRGMALGDFQKAIKRSPLSTHFLGTRQSNEPAPPRHPDRTWPKVIAVVCAISLCLAGASWYVVIGPFAGMQKTHKYGTDKPTANNTNGVQPPPNDAVADKQAMELLDRWPDEFEKAHKQLTTADTRQVANDTMEKLSSQILELRKIPKNTFSENTLKRIDSCNARLRTLITNRMVRETIRTRIESE